jgi:anhydro-N-acetylmuramic acid kinase
MNNIKDSDELFIGLMSGTSMDGIDAALVAFESANKIRVIETLFTEFDKQTRDSIYLAAQNNQDLRRNQDSPLHASLAPLYAKACLNLLAKAKVSASRISGIGNHGQTVKHEPNAVPAYSLQLGDGQIIANLTGIKTFTQFRQADLAAGGQGAPLMPAFHQALFSDQKNSLILNIGGISNITRLNETIVGFDTGPGNVLLDQWIDFTRGLAYDKNGEWAQSGKVNQDLLAALLNDPYFSMPHPKSTGTDYFNLDWISCRYPDLMTLAAEDIQATLVQLTVNSVSNALIDIGQRSGNVYVCGGGANNPTLMNALKAALRQFKVHTTAQLGLPSDWVEAVGFAWLGYCCAHGVASNLPSVTGANSKVVLGEAFTAQI